MTGFCRGHSSVAEKSSEPQPSNKLRSFCMKGIRDFLRKWYQYESKTPNASESRRRWVGNTLLKYSKDPPMLVKIRINKKRKPNPRTVDGRDRNGFLAPGFRYIMQIIASGNST